VRGNKENIWLTPREGKLTFVPLLEGEIGGRKNLLKIIFTGKI
jgi:hypothetical protein